MRLAAPGWPRQVAYLVLAAATQLLILGAADAAEIVDTIARVKTSIVAVGTFERDRSPPFEFRGTGFVVGDGTLVATAAHVLPPVVDARRLESLAILVPGKGTDSIQVHLARPVSIDTDHDLTIVKFDGVRLPALTLRGSAGAKEGQDVLMTGFPIGTVLGLFPSTHRGMISAITPIAIAQARATELDPAVIKRLSRGVFPVLQLDAVAYPGNSGSPVYDPQTGEVLGVVNMTFVKGTKEAALTQPSGITYAVPAQHLKDLLLSGSSESARK